MPSAPKRFLEAMLEYVEAAGSGRIAPYEWSFRQQRAHDELCKVLRAMAERKPAKKKAKP